MKTDGMSGIIQYKRILFDSIYNKRILFDSIYYKNIIW